MNVSKEWVAQQAAKAVAPVREGWRYVSLGDGRFRHADLTIFIAGKPRNFKSAGQTTGNGLMKHRRLVKEWRTRTCDRLLEYAGPGRTWPWLTREPKRVTFTVYSRNAFDSDGREVACSPSRDALKDMRLVTDDRDSAGNAFAYDQVTSRKADAVHGIAVRIETRSP